MKSSIYLLGLIAAASSIDLNLDLFGKEWNAFKLKYGKTYKNIVEESCRRTIFMGNKQKIAIHNEKFELDLVSYTLGMNQFGDMTHQEIISTMTGYSSDSAWNGERVTFTSPANISLPIAVDWRDKGAVTPIKDQGYCGSGWAFSTTGSLEGQHFLHHGDLVSLSEQNLLDCSEPYGNYGCDGGSTNNAFKYIKENGGIDTEISYPYRGTVGTCFEGNTVVSVTGVVDIPVGNEEKLAEAVATVGPVSAAMDASQPSFLFYNEGIYDDPSCGSSDEAYNHAVLIVGYGSRDGQDYWVVKNSWAPTWGDNGYMKILRNTENFCGLANLVSYPLV